MLYYTCSEGELREGGPPMEPYVIIDGEAYWDEDILTVHSGELGELLALVEAEEAQYGTAN